LVCFGQSCGNEIAHFVIFGMVVNIPQSMRQALGEQQRRDSTGWSLIQIIARSASEWRWAWQL